MVTPDLLDTRIRLEGQEPSLTEQKLDRLAAEPDGGDQSDAGVHSTLAESVRESVERYIATMGDQEIEKLYELVLSEVEAPLLESVLKSTNDNQSRTAQILGLNRGTLRKKLRKYGML